MPQINLLSPALGKKIRKAKTFALPKVDTSALSKTVIHTTFPLFVVLLGISLILFILVSKKTIELNKLKQQEQSLAINPQELLKLNNRKTSLEKKNNLLAELSSRTFLWTDKLNDLSDCLPSGVWLTEIFLTKKKVTQENPSGKREEIEWIILSIRGSAIAPQIDDAVSFIGEFVDALKQKTSFAGDFSEIKLNAINKGTIGKTDVMNFELLCFLR